MPDEKIQIKNFFEPRKEFIEETRILFLERIELKGKTAVISGSIFIFRPFVKYAITAFLIIIFLSGGLVIYADSKNVSPNNPLYGCKKIGEKMRVVFAPKERKPMIDHQIARRRIDEMHRLKEMDDHMMRSLNEEYKKNLDLSLDEMAGLEKERMEQIKKLCAEIAKTMAQKIEIVKASSVDDHISDHFKEHCGEIMELPLMLVP